MRSLREMNVSKLVADDVSLFSALLDDLFPSQKVQKRATPGDEKDTIMDALLRVCTNRGLQPQPAWIKKCIQLYETSLVRHGIMVIGPPGSGKSMAIDCLATALTEMGQKTVVFRMNPKAITAPQMFGRLDPTTGDWTDGVFSNLWRKAAKAPKGQSIWIVLDGPVDAVWIENLNTVLDDNKVLTLANGDRIAMSPHMRLIFEAENLKNASPATVSRAGIIYLSSSELGWHPLIQSWMVSRAPRERAALSPLFDKYLAPLLEFVRVECTPVVALEEACLVNTLCTMLTGALSSEQDDGVRTPAKWILVHSTDAKELHNAYERCFLLCISWAVGGVLSQEDRCRYDNVLRRLAFENMPEIMSSDETIFDYGLDEASGNWVSWRHKVPSWTPQPDQQPQVKRPVMSSMMVPTVDSVRYEWLLSTVRAAGGASLLVGGSGTAKTTIVQQYLSRLDVESHIAKTITFSSLSTPHIFQTALEGFVDKIQGRTYGPPGGKIATIFLDDVSMPAINKWGDQETNELVRQVLEQNGWYSTSKPVGEWKSLTKVSFIAAMGLPDRMDIPNRLKRQFCIFHIPPPTNEAIKGIFGQLMHVHFHPDMYPALSNTAQQVVSATISLLQAVKRHLVPAPSKFHYSFTMRDVSKVFQGIMTADIDVMIGCANQGRLGPEVGTEVLEKTAVSSSSYLATLWAHECRRVFADRLICHEDARWVDAEICKAAREHFTQDVEEAACQSSAIFADFLRDPELEESTGEPIGPRPKCYEMVPGGLSQTRSRVEALVEEGYRSGLTGEQAPPKLVLFNDALAHAVRIARILSMERGSALLVGVEGSGKQSLARLAAYLAGVSIYKITPSKSYGVANLLEDLRAVYKAAAFQTQPLMLLLTESDIRYDSFLEYFNQILMTGEVAGLFPRDEMDALLSDVRPLMRSMCPALPDTRDNLYSFFINRVRDRLHIVLCVSPMGSHLSRWAVQFPGIINGCTIDWFLPWPDDALFAVSSAMLDTKLLAARKVMAAAHAYLSSACNRYRREHGRSVFFTPKSYISALKVLQSLYDQKSHELQTLLHQLKAGLEKMDNAKNDVNGMSVQLAAKEIELEKSNKEAAKLLEEIRESTAATEKEKSKVASIVHSVRQKVGPLQVINDSTHSHDPSDSDSLPPSHTILLSVFFFVCIDNVVQAEEIASVKADAEKDLAQAQPALDAALKALNSIAPKDIVSLKALRSPPDVIKRIFDCVLLLRHYPVNPITWHEVKGSKVILGSYEEAVRMMGDLNFLQALLFFPKEAINDETVELLQPYFQAADFNYESARKASGNVAGLCNWAASMCTYHDVAKAVQPKIAALSLAEKELAAAQEEQAEAEAELAKVQASFEALQERLQDALNAKKALEDDAASTRKKMENATKLLGALGGEGERWREEANALAKSEECLLGDCIVMSIFLSYGGAFNRSYRESIILVGINELCSKHDLPVTSGLDPTTFLVNDEEIARWAEEGLPGDPLSLQNGILVTRATKYPLLIDPQGQGRAWLAKHEGLHGLVVTNLKDNQLRASLESCLIHGRPLLIENVDEELDPMLEPVLNKNYVQRGKDLIVTLGDQEVQVAQGFRLYLACRLPNPSFSPDIQTKLSMIDFTVTVTGLEDQLLGVLVLMEREQLEHRRRQLASEIISSRAKISKLESDLLVRLSSSTGNLLEDTGLIDMLSVTKQTAMEVATKLATAASARKEISEACEEYRPAAHRATLLYFLMSDFSRVNCMYQTSLEQFTKLYENSIECTVVACPTVAKVSAVKRVATIIEHFTRSLFEYVQRGLYERHKFVFASMLALRVAVSKRHVQETEVETYLKLGTVSEASARSGKRKPKEWVSPVVWNNILMLSTSIPKPFASLPDLIITDEAAWKAWNDGETPEAVMPPIQVIQSSSSVVSSFYRACLVRAFREDRAMVALQQFVLEVLNDQAFIEPPKPELEDVFSTTGPLCPIVCLLSPGADPTKSIEEMAKKRKIRCASVSMGQGQELVARKLVASAAADGHWVLIQNAHLSIPYMAEIEQFLVDARKNRPHEDFRLWITTEPEMSFPLGILYTSIKLTNEAPSGVRASMRSVSYDLISQDSIEAVPSKEWRRMLYVLCYMHSVIQERRRFGPIGWNVPYEFNVSDLGTSIQFAQNHMLDMYLKRSMQPDWPTLKYMISTIIYGGRITDEQDRILMDAFTDRYLNESLFESSQSQNLVKRSRSSGFVSLQIPGKKYWGE